MTEAKIVLAFALHYRLNGDPQGGLVPALRHRVRPLVRSSHRFVHLDLHEQDKAKEYGHDKAR